MDGAEPQHSFVRTWAALCHAGPEPRPLWHDILLVVKRLLLIALGPKRHGGVMQVFRDERLTLIRIAQPQLPYKYLRHDYLANSLTRADRAWILTHHYGFLASQPCPEIVDYVSGPGIRLWRHIGTMVHEIRLRLADPVDNQGELALDYLADGLCIGVIAFSFAPAALFDSYGRAVPLVSRVQSPGRDATLLRRAARDHRGLAPRLALAAALRGVAAALRLPCIVAVSRSNQIAYATDSATILASSYDDFYRMLGGRPARAGYFVLDVRFREGEPAQASSAHRRRSRRRRLIRQAVAQGAERATTALFRNEAGRAAAHPAHPFDAAARPRLALTRDEAGRGMGRSGQPFS